MVPCFVQAITIAVRYGAVRRQFSSGRNQVRAEGVTMYHGVALIISSRDQVETQLLDYPIHQRRLLVSSIRSGCPHLLEADPRPS
jgi:hypothetical protein